MYILLQVIRWAVMIAAFSFPFFYDIGLFWGFLLLAAAVALIFFLEVMLGMVLGITKGIDNDPSGNDNVKRKFTDYM